MLPVLFTLLYAAVTASGPVYPEVPAVPTYEIEFTCDVCPCVVEIKIATLISDSSTGFVRDTLAAAERAGADEILFGIESLGGETEAGLNMYEFLKNSKVPVTCWVDHIAASTAAWVLQACDTRVLTPGSSVMIHRPYYSLRGDMHEQDLRNLAEQLVMARRVMFTDIADRTGMTRWDIEVITAGETDWWLNTQTAVQAGVVDRVIDYQTLVREMRVQ